MTDCSFTGDIGWGAFTKPEQGSGEEGVPLHPGGNFVRLEERSQSHKHHVHFAVVEVFLVQNAHQLAEDPKPRRMLLLLPDACRKIGDVLHGQ